YAVATGRPAPEKGLHAPLAAWESLQGSLALLIIGDGPPRPAVEKAAREIVGLKFAGRLPHDEVLAALKGARFLVMPSQCYENFPLVIVEAFACGVPVIAPRLCSMLEIVGDGRCGVQFAPGR